MNKLENFDKWAMRWMWIVFAICLLKVCTACAPAKADVEKSRDHIDSVRRIGELGYEYTLIRWENHEAVCFQVADQSSSLAISCIKKDVK